MPLSFSTLLEELKSYNKVMTTRPYSDYWMDRTAGAKMTAYWKLRVAKEKKDHHFLGNLVLLEDPEEMSFIRKDGRKNPDVSSNRITTTLDISNEEYARLEGFESFETAIEDWFKPNYGSDFLDMSFVNMRWIWIIGEGFQDIDAKDVRRISDELKQLNKITVSNLKNKIESKRSDYTESISEESRRKAYEENRRARKMMFKSNYKKRR